MVDTPKKRLTLNQIEHTLEQSNGNISYAARSLGVARNTLYKRINKNPRLQKVLDDARETLVDTAESALLTAVRTGNIAAIIFTLKTQGKARGYIERQEIAGVKDAPLFVVNWDDANGNGEDSQD